MSNLEDGKPLAETPVMANEPSSVVPDRQIPEIIPPGLDSALRTAGVDTADPNVTKALEISLMLFRGQLPLPPPPVLAEYEKHFPGLCEKLIGWTETQRAHRQELERKRTDGAEKRMDRGQLIAGGVAIWGLTMAVIAGVWSAPVGVAIAIVSIGGPTAAIWLARNTGKKLPDPPPPQRPREPSRPRSDAAHKQN